MGAAIKAPRKGNLPGELTSFVGRRQETGEVKRLLSDARLVTLTGPAGVGKSRLALHAAEQFRRAFPDGVWVIELAKLRDPSLVEHAFLAALEVNDHSTRAADTVLAESLTEKRVLLVVDNCEHVIDRVAELLSRLLAAAPSLSVLTTSRAQLGVAGEHTLPVPPLSMPGLAHSRMEPGSARQFEALELFEQRTAAVLPGFALTEENEVTVAQICQTLDGLPLAIELAAARMRLLSADEILARLSDRYPLLTTGDRSAPERHQTLQAAMMWSFDLCSAQEAALWAQLSVFAGGFDLDAAQAVCSDIENVLECVAGLVDKSIVTREPGTAPARYRLLETIREFGRGRLLSTGKADEIRRQHLQYYTQLAEQAEAEWFGAHQSDVSARLQQEQANLWAALDHACSSQAERAALRMFAALWPYWIGCGRLPEGRAWSARVLASGQEPGPERARALWVAGWVALLQGDLSAARELLIEGRDLAQRIDDRSALTYATEFLGAVEVCSNNFDRAISLLEEAAAGHRQLGQQNSITMIGLNWLALAEHETGNISRTKAICDECEFISGSSGEKWAWSWVLWVRAHVAWLNDEHSAAHADLCEALRLKKALNDELGITFCINALAWLAIDAGENHRAASLMGASRALWHRLGNPFFAFQRVINLDATYQDHARSRLGHDAFEQALENGAHMTLEQAISLAANEPATDVHQPSSARENHLPELTKREKEVAKLVAEGLSNRDIATSLVIAPRTAEAHVEHILHKLGFTSRAQIVAYIKESSR